MQSIAFTPVPAVGSNVDQQPRLSARWWLSALSLARSV
jgi:hypothetical protein